MEEFLRAEIQDKHKHCFYSTLPFMLILIQLRSLFTGPPNPISRQTAGLAYS